MLKGGGKVMRMENQIRDPRKRDPRERPTQGLGVKEGMRKEPAGPF